MPHASTVKSLRQARYMSLKTLGDKIGTSATYVWRFERGDYQNPSIHTLRRFAKALGVPVARLIEK